MLIKCIFNSSALRRLKSTHLLSTEFANPAFTLYTDRFGVRHAGHSKWQNIKKTKETKDVAKCRAYNAAISSLRKAVMAGSSDPKLNPKLASIIKQAQTMNMPLTTINNVIKRFEKLKNNPPKFTLQYKSNNGVIIILKLATDNVRRTSSEMNYFLKKYNVKKAEGNVVSAFYEKGTIVAKFPENVSNSMEKAVDDAIEVGAEEVEQWEESTEMLKFSCDLSDLNIVKTKLEGKNYQIESCEEEFIPRNPVELSDEEYEKLDELLLKLEEFPELEKVIVNTA